MDTQQHSTISDVLRDAWPQTLDAALEVQFDRTYSTTWNLFLGEHGGYMTTRDDDKPITAIEGEFITAWCAGWDAAAAVAKRAVVA